MRLAITQRNTLSHDIALSLSLILLSRFFLKKRIPKWITNEWDEIHPSSSTWDWIIPKWMDFSRLTHTHWQGNSGQLMLIPAPCHHNYVEGLLRTQTQMTISIGRHHKCGGWMQSQFHRMDCLHLEICSQSLLDFPLPTLALGGNFHVFFTCHIAPFCQPSLIILIQTCA